MGSEGGCPNEPNEPIKNEQKQAAPRNELRGAAHILCAYFFLRSLSSESVFSA